MKENIDENTSKRIKSSQVLSEVVVISSDRDNETDYGSKDISTQRSNHSHLREFLPVSVDPVNKFGLVPRESEQPSHDRISNDLEVEVKER